MPAVAASVAAVTVLAAIAAVAFVVTRPASSESTEAAARQPLATASGQPAGETESLGTAVPTTGSRAPTTTPSPSPTPPPVPAFAGTYETVVTYTSAEGVTADDYAVGEVSTNTWTVTPSPTCTERLCDVSIDSTSGNSFQFVVPPGAVGTWTRQPPTVTGPCIEDGTGIETGVIVTVAVQTTLRASAVPAGVEEISAFSGEGTNILASDCDGNPATYAFTLTLTRTGD